MIVAARVAGRAKQRRDLGARGRAWHSRTSAPPGASTSRAARTSSPVWPASTTRDARLPVAHLGLERRRARPRATYGGFETTRSNGPGEAREERRRGRARPRARAARRSRARARARPAETSVAVTRASGRSSASASAIAPLPVPTSTTRGASTPSIAASARSTTISVSGRGTSARASVAEHEPPEAPLAEHVGERLARGRAARRARAPGPAPPRRARPVVRRRELEPREAERASPSEQLGVEPRRVDALALEELARSRAGARRASPASSARRRSSAVSASVNSSSAP